LIPVVLFDNDQKTAELVYQLMENEIGVTLCFSKEAIKEDDLVFRREENSIVVTQSGEPRGYIHLECCNCESLALLLGKGPRPQPWQPPFPLNGKAKRAAELISKVHNGHLN